MRTQRTDICHWSLLLDDNGIIHCITRACHCVMSLLRSSSTGYARGVYVYVTPVVSAHYYL